MPSLGVLGQACAAWGTTALVTPAQHLAGSRPEELPQVAQWREAFRAFGAKPQRTWPSVEALLCRLTGVPRIDRITDVYNAVSS